MNKLLIVGHLSADANGLEAMLAQLGFARAHPSKREQLPPGQITAIICKAQRIPLYAHERGEHSMSPLKVGAVWHGLALDLVLGNIEQPAWYWSDPRAIFLLDYWHEIDPELRFVLLYDDPSQALLRAPSETGESTESILGHWSRYNQALLAFYRRHRNCCTLVHARQVPRESAERLKELLDLPVLAPVTPDTAQELAAEPAKTPALATGDALTKLIVQIGLAPSDQRLGEMTGQVVAAHLLPQLLASHQSSTLLYEELQATANLPGPPQDQDQPTVEEAWRNFVQTREHLTRFISRLVTEKDALSAELQAKPSVADEPKLKDLEEENELLLLQLHQVQEELERYFLENQELEARIRQPATRGFWTTFWPFFKEGRPAKSKTKSTTVAPSPYQSGGHYYGAAERVKQQLTYRLGAIMVSYSKQPKKWLSIPGALIKESKQFDREKPEREARKLPPIDTYADAYEAERVKRHLSYRLGAALMENRKSPLGWITMPWKMHRAVREFRAERN